MSFIYKGLKAELTKHIVTDAEVDRSIQRLQQQNPRIAVIKDRATQNGDEVVLDYAGYCDGVQFEGGTAQNQTLVLGSGMFIPGFEEQLLDKVPEEPILVQVTFPEVYHSEALAGKKAEFHCTIHEIRVKTMYELDDVFAQEVGGCYTFEEMKEALKKSLITPMSAARWICRTDSCVRLRQPLTLRFPLKSWKKPLTSSCRIWKPSWHSRD